MTEKSYGGNNGVREHTGKIIQKKSNLSNELKDRKSKVPMNKEDTKEDHNIEDYKKAGEIAKQVVTYSKSIIKKDMLLLDIARLIDKKIYELHGIPAFPVNLSINEIAAHYHPTIDDDTKARDLLKVDIGVHVNGFIADTAFSMDLTEDKRYEKLINASVDALDSALKLLEKNSDTNLNDIGATIQETIEKSGFSPITNLSGHGLGQYNIHHGITIPNYANTSNHVLDSGGYAIEPFATTGVGKVRDGPSSNIYAIINIKTPRGPTARKILEYVAEKYKTLPFSLREIQEKFGPMAKLGIRELEQLKVLHNFPQLIEKSLSPVSQAEHTIIKSPDGKMIVTTR